MIKKWCLCATLALGVLAASSLLTAGAGHAGNAKLAPALFTETDPLYSAAQALEHWWPGDGHGLDLVGGRHAALKNGAAFAPGRVGKAFAFDGAMSVVDLGKPAASTPTPAKAFTLMFWFRAEEQSGWQYLAFCWGNAGMDINISELHPGRVAGQLGRGLGHGDTYGKDWSNATATFHPMDQWHHLAFSFDGTHARLFRNGTLASETPWTIYEPSDTPLLLGAEDRQVGVTSLKGLIQDVAMFRRGLSATEVAAVYEAQTAPVAMTIGAADLQKFETALDAKPAPLAWYAAQRLASDAAAARAFFRPPPAPDPAMIATHIRALDADSYPERQRASEALGAYGASIAPTLRAALEQNPSPEMANRVHALLAGLETSAFTPGQTYAARIAAILTRVSATPAKPEIGMP